LESLLEDGIPVLFQVRENSLLVARESMAGDIVIFVQNCKKGMLKGWDLETKLQGMSLRSCSEFPELLPYVLVGHTPSF
jgi:hypothetical protein